jgi:hypothetical protein
MQELQSAWDQVTRDFRAACSQAAQAARSETISELNQTLRRLQQYRDESEWISAVLDGVRRFAEHAALFSVDGDTLRLRGQYNFNFPADLSFPLASGQAFANAVNTKDSIIALCTPNEVTRHLSAGGAAQRAQLVPILNGPRVAAILFISDEEDPDATGLELVAGMASLALERAANSRLNVQIAPLPAPVPGPEQTAADGLEEPAPPLPSLASLSDTERSHHLRALRFARVRVAEMELFHPDACRGGREQNNVYLFLKKEIDRARELYREQFMTSRAMVDYLHLELVRTAAEGDESRLGADYPGILA